MSLSILLQELADNPGTIAAWEVDRVGNVALTNFEVASGTKQLTSVVVGSGEKDGVTAKLSESGHLPGEYGVSTGIVWRLAGNGFTVWNSEGQQFHADGKRLAFAETKLDGDDTMQVVAFLDDDLIDRGVRIRLRGVDHLVVKVRELSAAADISYGPMDALDDCGWTVYLGRALADFLGCDFVDATS